MLFKLADKCIGLASTLILARLLVPADFGLVALAMAVIAFTQLMGAFGFDSALIQRQDATRVHYDTAWTFNVIVGVAMGCTLAALAVPVARFYDDDRLVAILSVLGAGAVVGALVGVGVVGGCVGNAVVAPEPELGAPQLTSSRSRRMVPECTMKCLLITPQ